MKRQCLLLLLRWFQRAAEVARAAERHGAATRFSGKASGFGASRVLVSRLALLPTSCALGQVI